MKFVSLQKIVSLVFKSLTPKYVSRWRTSAVFLSTRLHVRNSWVTRHQGHVFINYFHIIRYFATPVLKNYPTGLCSVVTSQSTRVHRHSLGGSTAGSSDSHTLIYLHVKHTPSAPTVPREVPPFPPYLFCSADNNITSDLATPPLQWVSSLPKSFEILVECLTYDKHAQTTQYYVSHDIPDGFTGQGGLSDLDIL